jgi:hypothetical protein
VVSDVKRRLRTQAYAAPMPPQTPLHPGETLVRESRANLQRGLESVGGHLYLTDQRLLFESHRFNLQRGATEVPLADIAGVRKVWTKFLGVLPIMPNSLAIARTSGDEVRIVCGKRDDWIEAIGAKSGAAPQQA